MDLGGIDTFYMDYFPKQKSHIKIKKNKKPKKNKEKQKKPNKNKEKQKTQKKIKRN